MKSVGLEAELGPDDAHVQRQVQRPGRLLTSVSPPFVIGEQDPRPLEEIQCRAASASPSFVSQRWRGLDFVLDGIEAGLAKRR